MKDYKTSDAIMDINEIYHFLFETYAGIGVLVGAGIVLSLIASVIFEFRTRKLYRNHEVDPENDEWTLFEEFDEAILEGEIEEESGEPAQTKKGEASKKPADSKEGADSKKVAQTSSKYKREAN